MAEMVPHVYLSTACLHGQHGYCSAPTVTRDGEWSTVGPSYTTERDAPKNPAKCKFCQARCVCDCHRAESGRERSPEPPRDHIAGVTGCDCTMCREVTR